MDKFPGYGWAGVLCLLIAFVIAGPAGAGLTVLTGLFGVVGIGLVLAAWIITSERNRRGS